MAQPATPAEEQQFRQRAMRRLAFALALIVAAIVGLGLLDHYSGRKRAVAPETPTGEPPPIANLPPPVPLEPGSAPAQAPAVQPPAALPPPPPPTVEEQPSAPSRAHPPTRAELPGSTGAPSRSASVPAVESGKPRAPSGDTTAPGAGAAAALDARQGFVVQLGVFTTVENAQSLQARLKEQGMPAFLETRVVVGPFRDRAEADAAQRKLNELGARGVIVQRK